MLPFIDRVWQKHICTHLHKYLSNDFTWKYIGRVQVTEALLYYNTFLSAVKQILSVYQQQKHVFSTYSTSLLFIFMITTSIHHELW